MLEWKLCWRSSSWRFRLHAVGFLQQQIAAYPAVEEHPDPDTYDNFWAKKQVAAKRKTEGNNSDDNREEERSQKKRQVHRRVPEDEMEVDTDVPVRDQSGSWMSALAVDFSDAGCPNAFRMGSLPLSNVEGVASPSGVMSPKCLETG
jgi:hypothetical protein